MKQRVTLRSKKEVGSFGERLVEGYVRKRGYEILAKNFRKPWGELDIVCLNKGKIHVLEVKTAINVRLYRLEEQIHPAKIRRIFRTAMSYMLENEIDEAVPWQMDAFFVSLRIDETGKLKGGTIKALANIIGG